MEGFLRMKEDLDKIIQNDFQIYEEDDDPPPKSDKAPSSSSTPIPFGISIDPSTPSKPSDASSSSPPPPAPPPPPPPTSGEEPPFGEKLVAFFERSNLKQFMATNLFQVCIILLVVLDCLFVLIELVADLQELYDYGGTNWGLDESGLALFFHVASFVILNIFMIEFAFKIFVYQKEYLYMKFEIFDALVVVVSWSLDIALLVLDKKVGANAFQLLIVLRLWRVARIVNGIIQGIRTRNQAKVKKHKDFHTTAAAEVEQLKIANSKLEEELTHLRTVARKYGVPESSLQRYRTSSNNNSFEKPEVGVVTKKAEVSVVQMTQESEYL